MAKRISRRFALEMPDESGELRLVDLSLMGMRIATNRSLRLEETVEATIRVVDGSLRLRGRVVRARLSGNGDLRYDYGATMLPMPEEGEARLASFIQRLSHSSRPLPELPEPKDVEELQLRIATLQSDLTDMMDRHRMALSQRDELSEQMRQRREAEAAEADFGTAFDPRRFRHLLKLGQPLIPLVPEPLAGFSGRRFQLLAPVLEDQFDLQSVTRAVGRKMTAMAVTETLFDLYEEGRIDFA